LVLSLLLVVFLTFPASLLVLASLLFSSFNVPFPSVPKVLAILLLMEPLMFQFSLALVSTLLLMSSPCGSQRRGSQRDVVYLG
jgi:hypothetical protein